MKKLISLGMYVVQADFRWFENNLISLVVNVVMLHGIQRVLDGFCLKSLYFHYSFPVVTLKRSLIRNPKICVRLRYLLYSGLVDIFERHWLKNLALCQC